LGEKKIQAKTNHWPT